MVIFGAGFEYKQIQKAWEEERESRGTGGRRPTDSHNSFWETAETGLICVLFISFIVVF